MDILNCVGCNVTLIISLMYYILLIIMFFTRVDDILLILVGIGVFIIITIEYMKIRNENIKTINRIYSFIISALVSGIVLIVLSILQSKIIGYDTTDMNNYKVFKLYATLGVFVINNLWTKYILSKN